MLSCERRLFDFNGKKISVKKFVRNRTLDEIKICLEETKKDIMPINNSKSGIKYGSEKLFRIIWNMIQ